MARRRRDRDPRRLLLCTRHRLRSDVYLLLLPVVARSTTQKMQVRRWRQDGNDVSGENFAKIRVPVPPLQSSRDRSRSSTAWSRWKPSWRQSCERSWKHAASSTSTTEIRCSVDARERRCRWRPWRRQPSVSSGGTPSTVDPSTTAGGIHVDFERQEVDSQRHRIDRHDRSPSEADAELNGKSDCRRNAYCRDVSALHAA